MFRMQCVLLGEPRVGRSCPRAVTASRAASSRRTSASASWPRRDVTSAASYAEMTVADIIVCAGVSRRTFYEHFENKQSAFLAAYDEAVGRLLEGVRWAYSTREDLPRACGRPSSCSSRS